ncbi:MAG: TIGR03545 family protein [Gammaproteobacteria bacterium]|nr:TIGR03545 family protein [Gammaproteobacteria bacterium]
MKSIRWGGLITFVITMLVFASALLFAGTILKPLMESSFTAMNGAKVDIESVDVSYSPLTLEIKNIQIADQEQAMVNAVQIDQVKFAASFGQLFLGKLIIDEASIHGIRIDTPRHKPGLIVQSDDEDLLDAVSDDSLISMPKLEVLDVKSILASNPLLSDKLIDELDKDFSDTEVQWKTISESLPDKEKSDEYDTRFNNIKIMAKGDAKQKITAIKDAKQLSSELKEEVKKVKQAKDRFGTDIKRINAELKVVKAAPAKDIAMLKSKYSLDNMNAENISQMIFGEQVAGYTALAKKWYRRIEPYLSSEEEVETVEVERSKGRDVVFHEFRPMPVVYIGLASITANLPRGLFEGTITAISSDQTIKKEATRFKLQGVSLSNKDSETVSGEFNYIDKNNGFSKIKYSVVKSKIDDFVLSRSDKLPLTMKQAVMDFDLNARFQQGSLNGMAKMRFKEVAFDSGDTSSLVANSFKGVSAFAIDSRFNGSVNNLSIKIDSDLDNQLSRQLKNKLNQEKKKFEDELKVELDKKLKSPMDKIEAKKARLNSVKNKIDDREKQLQQKIASLKTTIDSEKTQKKKEASDKLKNKLKDKFGF